VHTGKELESHKVQKVYLSRDSDAPQVGNARSDSTSVVKVVVKRTVAKRDPTVFVTVLSSRIINY